MKKIFSVFFTLILFFTVGCAGPQIKMEKSNMVNAEKTNYLIEPYQSIGLLETEHIKKGEFTVFQGIFPDLLFGEYSPGRMSWYGIAITPEGQEFFVQVLLSGINCAGYFVETIVVDGTAKQIASAKISGLSSLVDYAYDLGGEEYPLERGKFIMDPNYRKQIVLSKGTAIVNLEKIPNADFKEIAKKWNPYQTPSGVIRTPLGDAEIKLIAGINPQYNFTQKLVGSGRFSLSMDPITTVSAMAIDLLRARTLPSVGWDYNSEIPTRRNMAMIIQFVLDMKQQLITEQNRTNAKLLLSKEER